MAAKTHLRLFIEGFIRFNLDRYEDNPEMLALFQGLTEAEVTVTDITDIELPVAGSRRSVVTSLSRNFKGIEQDWTPAVAETALKLFIVVNDGSPLADLAALEAQTTPGIYSYTDGATTKVGVVIGADVETADFATAVEAVLRAGLVYDIPTVTVPEGGSTVVLTGDTFGGTLAWVQGTAPVIVIPPTYYGTLVPE